MREHIRRGSHELGLRDVRLPHGLHVEGSKIGLTAVNRNIPANLEGTL